MTAAYLALGSNLGDRESHLTSGIAELDKTEEIEVINVSPLYETANVGPPAPDYLNCVIEISTSLDPEALLDACHRIEMHRGRDRTVEARWGARVLDIDILLFGASTIETRRLTIPHPRMMHRRFVLEPLAALQPDLEIPGFKIKVKEALAWPSIQAEKAIKISWIKEFGRK